MSAHLHEIEASISDAIAGAAFASRQSSWIAVNKDYFLKIPKRPGGTDDVVLDADTAAASREFYFANLFGQLDPQVLRPKAYVAERACLVFPRVFGIDLCDELLQERTKARGQLAIEEAVQIGARLHVKVAREALIARYDYCKDLFHPLQDPELLNQNAETVVIRGFEVRNFRRDRSNGRLQFFDMHEICWGMPEEDVTRFIVSLLMVRWGRKIVPLPWTRFDLQSICMAYDSVAPFPLDRRRMQYCFELNLRMRRHNAAAAVKAVPRPWRQAALAYMNIYFQGMKRWIARHGF